MNQILIHRWNLLRDKLVEQGGRDKVQKALLDQLIDKGELYESEEKNSLAERMYARVLERLGTNTTGIKKQRKKSLNFSKVARHLNQQRKSTALSLLKRKGKLVPQLEADYFTQAIEHFESPVESKVEQNRVGLNKLANLRMEILESVLKYHSFSNKPVDKAKVEAEVDEIIRGPYNVDANVKQFFDLVESRDAIWADDFKSLYKELSEISALFT